MVRLLLLLIVAGCCQTPVDSAIDLPARPILEPLDAELQADIAPHTLGIIGRNDLALKAHIKKLEQRVLLHDRALQD